MPFIRGDVALKELDATNWRVLEPLVYKGTKDEFTVPVGFKTDLASVPVIFTWLIPRYGVYTKAAVLHDFLCETKPVTRADADGLFRRVMRELGVPFLQRWMMWAAVRVGSNLVGASFGDVLIWLLVAVPSIIFLFVPALVVGVWLLVFWIIEWFWYVLLKPFSNKKMNKPVLIPRQR